MSLFLAIPVLPSETAPILQAAKQLFGDTRINWFDDQSHHITLARIAGTEVEELAWIERFLAGEWFTKSLDTRLEFGLTLTQFERFGMGEVIVITAPETNRLAAFTNLATSCWRYLKRLSGANHGLPRPKVRPHVSLGEVDINTITAADSFYDVPRNGGAVALHLTVSSVVLFHKTADTPSRHYRIVATGQLCQSKTH